MTLHPLALIRNVCNRGGNVRGMANKTINRINGYPNLIKEWLVHPRESRHFFVELYRRMLIYQRCDKIRRPARREFRIVISWTNTKLLQSHVFRGGERIECSDGKKPRLLIRLRRICTLYTVYTILMKIDLLLFIVILSQSYLYNNIVERIIQIFFSNYL